MQQLEVYKRNLDSSLIHIDAYAFVLVVLHSVYVVANGTQQNEKHKNINHPTFLKSYKWSDLLFHFYSPVKNVPHAKASLTNCFLCQAEKKMNNKIRRRKKKIAHHYYNHYQEYVYGYFVYSVSFFYICLIIYTPTFILLYFSYL